MKQNSVGQILVAGVVLFSRLSIATEFAEIKAETKNSIRSLAEEVRHEWWQSLDALTDGSFFFVHILEIGVGHENPRAQPGLPDRF